MIQITPSTMPKRSIHSVGNANSGFSRETRIDRATNGTTAAGLLNSRSNVYGSGESPACPSTLSCASTDRNCVQESECETGTTCLLMIIIISGLLLQSGSAAEPPGQALG